MMLLGSCLASGAAQAADFYMVYLSTEPDDYWVELIDPATIATSTDGHKTVRAARIASMDLWTDDRLEFDCSTNQYRYASSISHLAGGDTIDRMKIPGLLGGWETAKPGELDFLTRETVCEWSDSKMTGAAVYTAADFPTAALRISARLFEMEQQKK
jgi:hypothetical protein